MIKSKEQIINYFKSGIKQTKDFRIGIEHEKFLFNNIDNKRIDYSKIKEISTNLNNPVPLLKDLLIFSKNKYPLVIEIKPTFSMSLIRKLLKETSKFKKCVFIAFNHENVYNLLKINKNVKVGLSFAPPTSIKKILKEANDKNIRCLILDKSYLKNKKIQNLKIEKYFYTIKTKYDFNKYKKNYNLIFENL